MKSTAAWACIGGALLVAACGSPYKNVRHDRYVIYSGSPEALRPPGIPVHPHNIVYETCPDEHLPPASKLVSDHVEKTFGKGVHYGLQAWVDQVWIPGRDVQDGLVNAEIMVLAEVDDGVRGPVRTVIHRIEDVPEGQWVHLQERVPIYPLSPLTGEPYSVRIRIIELDEGQEREVKDFVDTLDMIGDAVKTFFSWVLPGGITELADRAGAMNRNDLILDARIDRIVPTLTMASETRANALRCEGMEGKKPKGVWRNPDGSCKSVGVDGPKLQDIDFSPHKSFAVVAVRDRRRGADGTERHDSFWYANGVLNEAAAESSALCPIGPPSGKLTPYEATAYAIVRVEAALVADDKIAAEVVSKRHADFRASFDARVKAEGIRDKATILKE